jgi:hypothetical protein
MEATISPDEEKPPNENIDDADQPQSRWFIALRNSSVICSGGSAAEKASA